MSNEYAKLVQQVMGIAQKAVPLPDWLDKGHLLADGSLRVDRFSVPFPLGTYYWLMPFLLPDPMTTSVAVVVGDHGAHSHDIPRPVALTPPQIGTDTDLLVAFVNGGVDPIIVGIIRRAV
jgi:hypothetical protein